MQDVFHPETFQYRTPVRLSLELFPSEDTQRECRKKGYPAVLVAQPPNTTLDDDDIEFIRRLRDSETLREFSVKIKYTKMDDAIPLWEDTGKGRPYAYLITMKNCVSIKGEEDPVSVCEGYLRRKGSRVYSATQSDICEMKRNKTPAFVFFSNIEKDGTSIYSLIEKTQALFEQKNICVPIWHCDSEMETLPFSNKNTGGPFVVFSTDREADVYAGELTEYEMAEYCENKIKQEMEGNKRKLKIERNKRKLEVEGNKRKLEVEGNKRKLGVEGNKRKLETEKKKRGPSVTVLSPCEEEKVTRGKNTTFVIRSGIVWDEGEYKELLAKANQIENHYEASDENISVVHIRKQEYLETRRVTFQKEASALVGFLCRENVQYFFDEKEPVKSIIETWERLSCVKEETRAVERPKKGMKRVQLPIFLNQMNGSG
ncbi:MAG: uncharacterized protein A8A55_1276 [Amphiamblys sp. WSBS2006]|nr:MAG: uncharacterized protein A8A55_1276 [Amphiamblys sp. WSBS2006]